MNKDVPVDTRRTVGEEGCHSRTAAGVMEEPGLVEGSHSLVVVEVCTTRLWSAQSFTRALAHTDTAAEAGIHTHSGEAVARSLLPDRRGIVGRGSRTCFWISEKDWVGRGWRLGKGSFALVGELKVGESEIGG
jgi:hypothetical protein